MEIPISNLIIIEGIAGSGKNILQDKIISLLRNKNVYSFSEDELLFSWKLAWIKNVDKLRLELMHSLLTSYEEKKRKDNDIVFVLNRFHISLLILAQNKKLRCDNIIERLRRLNPHIYVPILDKEQIEERSAHTERKDPAWKLYVKRKLKQRGLSNVTEMYLNEQEMIQSLLVEQKIPYTLVRVSKNGDICHI